MYRSPKSPAGPDLVSTAERRPSGLAAGVAVSLLLHGLLLFAWRHAPQPRPPLPGSKPPLTVWLRPAPQRLPPPPPELMQPERPPQPKPRKPPAAPAQAQAQAPAPEQHAASAPSPPMTVPAPPSAPSTDYRPAGEVGGPKFDMDAARRTARAVANEQDPAKAGTAVGQFPEKPLRSETRLARDIAQAKRGDCKDGLPGGLLAPIYLMLEKKDHGCKW